MVRERGASGRCRGITLVVVLAGLLSTAAEGAALFPWETENSVAAALMRRDGEGVVCEAAVGRIAARSDPPFFVLEDSFSKPPSKIVVLRRAPSVLRRGMRVLVEGTLGTLANGERCILDPTVHGYFRNGRPQYWMPFADLASAFDKELLPLATGPIGRLDPSLPDDGMGVLGEVTAYAGEGIWRFDTVASLVASAPPLLSAVELSCKRVASVGEGYVVIGDDTSDATVKVFTNASVKVGDRIINVSGTVHTEYGALVLYAGAGECFDDQGFTGGVTAVSPGTTAFASTLPDRRAPPPARHTASVEPGGTTDGNWVYLTGVVVTHFGQYYSYAIPNGGWIDVYNVQGIDGTPGIRVWKPGWPNPPYEAGPIMDIMAKVDTKDGERMLGQWSDNPPEALDLTLAAHSIESKVLDYGPAHLPPAGVNNRDLGGGGMGENPSVSDGVGLYNIGDFIRVWGEVLEAGTYQFDEFGTYTTPYIRIDDGSGVDSGNADPSYGGPYGDQGVTVFGTNWYAGFNQVDVGDYVSVTGVSSVWKPGGSSGAYRCVWTSGYAVGYEDLPATPQVTDTGTVSGIVKLYDMPESTATVRLYSTCRRSETLTITRGQNNSGSAEFEWQDVPKELDNWEEPRYTLSAHCDGYKTRTYTNVAPDTPRNLYLTRLRKIYVMTDATVLDSCPGGQYPTSAAVTATVVDSDRAPIDGVTVRFRTDAGSFSSGSIAHSTSGQSDSQGQVTVTLYGVGCDSGTAKVEATDDSAPVDGDHPDDDPYGYDWEQLHDKYGSPTTIYIYPPSTSLTLAADPAQIGTCGGDTSAITADLRMCGSAVADVGVAFTTTHGVFDETGTTSATATTNGSGIATVHLRASTSNPGTASISASAEVCGISVPSAASLKVEMLPDKLTLTADPYSVPPSESSSTITAKLTTPFGVAISGKQVTFTTTAGSPDPTAGTTNENGEVTTTLIGVTDGDFAVVEATTTDRCDETLKQRCQVDYLQEAADDWPMFMHDARHQGYSRFHDDVTTEDLTLVWSTPVPTADTTRDDISNAHPLGGKASYIFPHPFIDSSPVHATGCPVIVGAWASGDYDSSTGYVQAFNPSTGASVWRYPSNPEQFIGGVASTPAIFTVGEQKRVVFGSMDGKVYCLNASNGALIWSYQTLDRAGTGNGKILGSPTVYAGRVYIGNESSRMYCLNGETTNQNGDRKWSYELPVEGSYNDKTGLSSVAIGVMYGGEVRAFVGSDNGHVYCLSTADSPQQRVIWDYAGEDGLGLGCIESSPTAYAGNVYVGTSWYSSRQASGYDAVALSGSEGSLLWRRDFDEEARATCAAVDGAILVGVDTGQTFHGANWSSGVNRPDDDQHNPFDAALHRPETDPGYDNFFVGSAGVSSCGTAYVGNDNHAFYPLTFSTFELAGSSSYGYDLGGIVCSSPAISYAVDTNPSTSHANKWVYVVTRQSGGTICAYRQDR